MSILQAIYLFCIINSCLITLMVLASKTTHKPLVWALNNDEFAPFKDTVFKQRYVLLIPGCNCNRRGGGPIVPPGVYPPIVGPIGPGGNTQATLPPVSPSPGQQGGVARRSQGRRSRSRHATRSRAGLQKQPQQRQQHRDTNLNQLLKSVQSRLQAVSRMNFWRSPFLFNG